MKGLIKKVRENKKGFTLAELLDALGTTRKYALLFLEACDRRRITIREGNLRRLNMDVQVR